MANVVHPQPNPFGFAFGLSSSSSNIKGWSQQSMNHPIHHLAASTSQAPSRLKRRLEVEDENDSNIQRSSPGVRDESMDRSPTPERPKRAVPKRARTSPATNTLGSKDVKENKASESDSDIDVGVLLGAYHLPCLWVACTYEHVSELASTVSFANLDLTSLHSTLTQASRALLDTPTIARYGFTGTCTVC